MNLSRRSLLVVLGLGLLFGANPVGAQIVPPPAQKPTESSGFALKVDSRCEQILDAVEDYIEVREWGTAAQAMMRILDRVEPHTLVQRQGRIAGVHAEVARILKQLPPEGLAVYRKLAEPGAAKALREARQGGNDPVKMGQVVVRYPMTESAQNAQEVLTLLRMIQEVELAQKSAKGDSLMFGGDASRTQQFKPGTPFLKARWQENLIRTEAGEKLIEPILAQLERTGMPYLVSTFPITATVDRQGDQATLMVYRNWGGVNAVDLASGKIAWRAPSAGSIEGLASQPETQAVLMQWMSQITQTLQRRTAPLENTMVGTLSSDGERVYAVEDVALPPFLNRSAGLFIRPGQNPAVQQPAVVATDHNRLQAFQLSTGKLVWEQGGAGKARELEDSYFLGPPLPAAGRLWVLNDRQGELRLLSLDPATGKILSLATLGGTGSVLREDFLRRIQAAPLAVSNNTLVCPTGTGSILGVDLLTGNLLWVHDYRQGEDAPPAGPIFRPGLPPVIHSPDGRQYPADRPLLWGPPAPRIDQNLVVFSSHDTQSIHCIRLEDGSRAWAKPRQADDLYLAGSFGGKVLVVGKSACRCLDLADGDTLWETTTGEPSGFGAVAGDRFYLPLRRGGASGKPEVCSIDLKTGKVIARLESKDAGTPGNLLFHGESVISQGPATIAVYPQLEVLLRSIDMALSANPDDPAGLLDRAELRHSRGDLPGAVADIRKAREGKLDGALRQRVDQLLYTALTDLLERDFAEGEKYLAEYEKVLTRPVDPASPADQQKETEKGNRSRLVKSLILQAQGRAGQGKHAEAMRLALRLAILPGESSEYLELQPGLEVSRGVWARGFVEKLLAGAAAEERKGLEEELTRVWLDLQRDKGLDALRGFVKATGLSSDVGREARLTLAARLLGEKAYLEADLLLQTVRSQKADPRQAGQALALLVESMMEQEMFADALHYARIIERDFAKTLVRKTLTGKEFFDGMARDRRIVPLLNREPAFPPGNYVASEEKIPAMPTPYVYEFEQVGEPLPSVESSALGFDLTGHKLQLRKADRVAWTHAMPGTITPNIAYAAGNLYTVLSPLSATTLGPVALLPLGQKTVAVDLHGGKVLWQVDRYTGADSSLQVLPPLSGGATIDPQDGSRIVNYADGWSERIGLPLPHSGETVCLATRTGVVGVDLVSGKVRWKRTDLGPRCAAFGDDQHAVIVEFDPARQPTATHVLRLADGSKVDAPDSLAQFRQRTAVMGSRLLVKEQAGQNVVLSVHDAATGKTAWKKELPSGSTMLDSPSPGLTGWVEPDGKLSIVDLKSLQTVHEGKVDPQHFAKLNRAYLLADGDNWYLAASGQPTTQLTYSMPTYAGLSPVLVHGHMYAIEKKTGKVLWFEKVENQFLLANRVRDLPVLIFSSRTVQRQPQVKYVATAKVITKHNGKFIFDGEVPGYTAFYTMKADPDKKEIELISTQTKLKIAAKSP